MKLVSLKMAIQLCLACLIFKPPFQNLQWVMYPQGDVSTQVEKRFSMYNDLIMDDNTYEGVKDYIISTSYIEELIVKDKKGQRVVHEERMNQTFYTIECDDPRNAYIRLENDKCEKKPSVKICVADNQLCTRIFTFEYGKEISIDSCFIKYPSQMIHSPCEKIYDWIKSIFKEVRIGQVACGPTGALMGGNNTVDESNRLVYKEVDYSYYLDWMDFELSFNTWVNSEVEGIYVIEHQGEQDLVFCAGDVNEIAELYDITNHLVPSIDMVLRQVRTDENSNQYSLKEGVLSTMSLKEMERGKWYELNVKLKDDSTFYAFNFQFLSQKDLDFLNSLGQDE